MGNDRGRSAEATAPKAQANASSGEPSATSRSAPCVAGGAYVDGVFFDEAEPGAREDELATLSAHIDAATHRPLSLIRIMEVSERWAQQGAKSCAHWLSWRIGVQLGAAREQVRVARALEPLSKLDDALRRGALSYSKPRAMTRVATPANEERRLGIARGTTAAQLERVCRGIRQQRHQDEGAAASDVSERDVRMRFRGDGTVRIEAVRLADEGHRVMDAVARRSQRCAKAPRSRRSSPTRWFGLPKPSSPATSSPLGIHAETGLTDWDGAPIDYGACVEVVCAADDESTLRAAAFSTPELHDDDAPMVRARTSEDSAGEVDLDLPAPVWLAKHYAPG